MDVKFEIKGISELKARVESLNHDMRMKGGRAALRKAAQLVRDQARNNARRLDDPATSDQIYKNIVERWSSRYNKRTGDLMFRVGVLGGVFGKLTGDEGGVYGDKFTKKTRKKGAVLVGPGGDTRHWGYLEFGTEKLPARPFLRPAMEGSFDAIASVFVRQYNLSLDKLLKQKPK